MEFTRNPSTHNLRNTYSHKVLIIVLTCNEYCVKCDTSNVLNKFENIHYLHTKKFMSPSDLNNSLSVKLAR